MLLWYKECLFTPRTCCWSWSCCSWSCWSFWPHKASSTESYELKESQHTAPYGQARHLVGPRVPLASAFAAPSLPCSNHSYQITSNYHTSPKILGCCFVVCRFPLHLFAGSTFLSFLLFSSPCQASTCASNRRCCAAMSSPWPSRTKLPDCGQEKCMTADYSNQKLKNSENK